MAEPSREVKAPLAWSRAAVGGILALAVILPLAVVFNIAVGRMIHWDIVALIASAGVVGLTLAFRYAR